MNVLNLKKLVPSADVGIGLGVAVGLVIDVMIGGGLLTYWIAFERFSHVVNFGVFASVSALVLVGTCAVGGVVGYLVERGVLDGASDGE